MIDGTASFRTEVTQADAEAFARLSGDWNPLHTDAGHAAKTSYGRPVLHGAFSAGLLSRLAGMHLPGADCVLHAMRLRFVAPILPPAQLTVAGRITSESAGMSRVEATITDSRSGTNYVQGSYDFSRQQSSTGIGKSGVLESFAGGDDAPILITGATGGLGGALRARLGKKALGVSRRAGTDLLHAPDAQALRAAIGGRKIGGIVHFAWPKPGNERLLALEDPAAAVDHHVASPLAEMLELARLLASSGTDEAMLVLVGSTFAEPGRHGYRLPLYTLGKSLVPPLARILAVELAATNHRVAAVVFDVISGGMNDSLSPAIRQSHADRVPAGTLPDPAEAASQIAWVLENRSHLVSGATLTLAGGALP